MPYRIPFNKPFMVGKELHYIGKAVAYSNISGDGHFTQACSRLLEKQYGIHKVLMTPSCTAALEMAAMLCGVGAGDEVILPSFTFVSTANAFVRLGARPVFVDIRPDTLNLDERLVEAAVTPRTRAIVPVHYAGVGCDMDAILEVAAKHRLHVVEDAAQGVHATYKGRALGSMAPLAAYSFHETKNVICGEGGALCVNDPAFVERAEIIRDKGTNRKQFFRGQADKYTWVDVGSSYVPSEIICAFLFAQLETAQAITERRREVYRTYETSLAALESDGRLRMPRVPPECQSNCHMFYILLPDGATRDALLAHLMSRDINAVFHYVPLHNSPKGVQFGFKDGDLPVTEDVSARLLRLPFFYEITEEQQAQVVQEVESFLRGRAARPAAVVRPEPGTPALEVLWAEAAPAAVNAGPAGRSAAPKRVAILQSNYIPWKGYFDMIHRVDEFILFDDMQYTRRDWRNRNRVKTAQGVHWLTIPVQVKGKYFQAINETRVEDRSWARAHWTTLAHCYGRTRYFDQYAPGLEKLYQALEHEEFLSRINYRLLRHVCDLLGIGAKITWSTDYQPTQGKTERLVSLCQQAGAAEYLSGPAARVYIEEEPFTRAGIALSFMDYSGYPEYRQLYPPFEHAVTVLDLLFNEGPNAPAFMLSFASREPQGRPLLKAG